MQDGNNLTITSLEIGKSICHTIEQIEIIRQNNNDLQYENCYYLLFSRKRAPNFDQWKLSIQNKLQKFERRKEAEVDVHKSQNQQKLLSHASTDLGGYFCIDGQDRNTCLGPTFSTFIFRHDDSKLQISKMVDQLSNGI